MTAHYSAAWGHTLRSTSLHRQVKRMASQEPLPTFFQDKGAERPVAPPLAKVAARPVEKDIEPRKEIDPRVVRLRGLLLNCDSSVKQRFSREFLKAITIEERDDPQEPPFPPRYHPSHSIDTMADVPYGPPQQGFTLNMNRLSLVTLVFGLLLLGILFFAGGFMLAVNVVSESAPSPHPPAPQDYANPAPHQRLQHAPVTPPMPPQEAAPVVTPAPASTLPPVAAPVAAPPMTPAPATTSGAAATPQGQAHYQQSFPRQPYAERQQPNPSIQGSRSQIIVAARQEPVLDMTEVTRPYALQVGMYDNRDGALKIVDVLHKRGYNAYVVAIAPTDGVEAYAVRMGGYFTHQAAVSAAQHLMKKERFKVVAVTKNNAERVIL